MTADSIDSSSVRWRVFPLADRPARSAALAAFLAAFAALLVAAAGPGTAVAGMAFLLASIAPYLAPTHYALTGEELQIRFLAGRRRLRLSGLELAAAGADRVILRRAGRWARRLPGGRLCLRLPRDRTRAIRQAVLDRLRSARTTEGPKSAALGAPEGSP